MADKVILHIGPRKTGSTFIQACLSQSSQSLLEYGYLYPRERDLGKPWDHGGAFAGLFKLLKIEHEAPWFHEPIGGWRKLKSQINTSSNSVILSAECLGSLRSESIKLVLEELEASSIKVLISARNLADVATSSWGHHIFRGHQMKLDEYLDINTSIRDLHAPDQWPDFLENKDAPRWWRSYDYASASDRWAKMVGRENVSILIAAPNQPREDLWRKFLVATGIRHEGAANIGAISRSNSNPGYDFPEALVLRAFNELSSNSNAKIQSVRALHREFKRLVKRGEDRTDLAIPIPDWFRERAIEWSKADIERIRLSGTTVIGALDDLLVSETPDKEVQLDQAHLVKATSNLIHHLWETRG